MRVAFRLAAFSAAVLAGSAAWAAGGGTDAIVRLLNSRSSGSPQRYAAAAAAVAEEAAGGAPLQQFLIAVISRDRDAPRAAKLTEEVRSRYLENSKDRIAALAKEKNNALAWYLLALEANDRDMLERAASLGNVQALNALGTMKLMQVIDRGTGSAEDEAAMKEGFECFSRAAESGDANALNSLGLCRQNGYGCEKDEARAFECFKKAAAMKHPEATNNLGRFYREGIVVEKDLAEAARCFEKSASMGELWGQLNYATALMFGEGLPKNERRAVELLESIAKRGNAEAMDFLSKCYSQGLGGLEPDPGKAAVWMVRARAARGDANAVKWLKVNGESGK